MSDFDIIIVGSGPAGVSTAFACAESGRKILVLDGDEGQAGKPLQEPFLQERYKDESQENWMIGSSYEALKEREASSPKLRIPQSARVFKDFAEANRIENDGFMTVGSLARGGLSNAWGCGVSRLSEKEAESFPCDKAELDKSYARVGPRIGLSGACDDDMRDVFGVDDWAAGPIEKDPLHKFLHEKYNKKKDKLHRQGWRMGNPRIAVLSEDRDKRKACARSGNCMWGCAQKALYNAADEVEKLEALPNVTAQSGVVVEKIEREADEWKVCGRKRADSSSLSFTAKKVLLAAGTLASTRLALPAINYEGEVPVLSCPTAAFLLCLPRFLGAQRQTNFGLGQLSFAFSLRDDVSAFGSTFSPTGIAASEFIPYIPMRRPHALRLFRHLFGACVIGNLFLPGHLADVKAKLFADQSLFVSGGYQSSAKPLLKEAGRRVRNAFASLEAFMIPGGFTIGAPGSCIHYAGTMPMMAAPKLGQTNAYGEVEGAPGLYVVDAASLPVLSEKSHTLTLMANADRIGRYLGNNQEW